MNKRLKAFTLVEVLVVSSLIAISSIAIFRSFGNGLKLWARAERLNREAEVAIFLDKMSEDLRSTVIVSGLGFKGSTMQVSFPAIILTKADLKSSRASEGLVDQIGAVQYRFDSASHTIFRRQVNYAQAIKARWAQEEFSVASGVTDLKLQYEATSDKGKMLKSEINEGIPSGVMVEVDFSDDSGEHHLKRYLPIVVGG